MKKTDPIPHEEENPESTPAIIPESGEEPPAQEDVLTESQEIYSIEEEEETPAEESRTAELPAEHEEEAPADPLAKLDLSDPALVKALRTALNVDAEVAAARTAGEIAGRNARIEQLMANPDTTGDGLPFHGSGCAPAPLRAQSIFQLASQAR